MSKNIALVLPSKTKITVPALLKPFCNYYFNVIYLCDDIKEKILKKDITYDIALLSVYDIIIPVGAEALKYTCGLTGISKYHGTIVNDKYFPLMDPNIINIKPQLKQDFEKAFSKLEELVEGKVTSINITKNYKYINTDQEFKDYLEILKQSTHIVVDIETTSLSPRKGVIIGIAFSTKPHEGIFVDSKVVNNFIKELQELFNEKICIFHNAKFDIGFLNYCFGFTFNKIEDTILQHYCLDESTGSHGLKLLAMKFTDLGDYELELDNYKKEFARKNKILLEDFNYGMLPIDILAPYACKDADATYQLFEKFTKLIIANDNFKNIYNNLLLKVTESLMYLENTGGPVDLEYLKQLKNDYVIDIEECIAEIQQHPAVIEFENKNQKSFNPNSVFQIREVLFDILQLDPIKWTATDQASTDAETLNQIDHPLAKAILDLRKAVKMSRTYIANIEEGLDTDNRLRSSFNIIGTTSGRLSSSGVLNYQNLPRDKDSGIKKLFKANAGYSIVQADLGTAEVYVAAALSKDKFLQEAFIKKLDFHSYIAKQIFKLQCSLDSIKEQFKEYRQQAKAVTFGILYGAGAGKISEEANITKPEAQEIIDKYFYEAKELKKYIDSSLTFINQNCYIYSAFGRKRRLPEAKAANRAVASHSSRSGLNFLIQSVASDINLFALIDLIKWIKENKLQNEMRVFATVHDSIVAEIKNEYIDTYSKKLVEFIQIDRGVMIPNCPITVDLEVGPSWGEVKSYKYEG